MLERQCPRRQYLPVKAQVSRRWWTEVNLSASPTSPPHSHTWAVPGVCVCVCVCMCVEPGGETWRRQGFSRLDSRPSFFCGSDPGEPPFLSSLAPPPCFSASYSPFSSCLNMGGQILRRLSFYSTGGKRTSDHGMPLDSSETVRIHVNNACFTTTLVVLCLLTVHSRNLPPLYNALLQQSLCTFRSIFYTTVHQLCSGIETV